jgi:hypothetical protein
VNLVTLQSELLLRPLSREVYVLHKISQVDVYLVEVLTKLRSKRTILRNACPVVWPGLVPVCTDTDHRLNRKAHAGLRRPDGFVLCIMRNIRCTMEKLVDTVSTVRPDDTTVLALRMLLNDIAVLAEQSARLNHFDSLSQAFSGRFRHTYCVRVCQRLVTNVVCLVKVAVEAAVVEGYVDVEDVAVLEHSLVGNAVADDFVYRCAY